MDKSFIVEGPKVSFCTYHNVIETTHRQFGLKLNKVALKDTKADRDNNILTLVS